MNDVFGFHPVNLAFRFVLEIAALVALGLGGYALGDGPTQWVFAALFPLVAVLAWATFNVPGDRSRSGAARVPVPGLVRLLVELDVFAAAVIVVWFANPTFSVVLLTFVSIHYLMSIDRIKWLLRN